MVELGMVEVGRESWLSQVRCCWVLLVVGDCRCLGPILLGFCWSFVGLVLVVVGGGQ